jgi:outer membrane protein assembly factor BamB
MEVKKRIRKMKKREGKGIALLVSAIIVIAVTSSVAVATDWQQFQKDEINSGWTTDCAPVYDPPTLAWWKQTTGTGMGGIDVTPIVGDGDVYVLDYQGVLWSFDAKTGTENWNTDLTEGSGTFELSVPAYHNGIVYAAVSSGSEGQGAGRVCAVNANDGSIRECEYYGLQYFQLNTPITYADGKIYIGNWKGGSEHTEDNGTYYCIDASDVTNEIWSRTAPYVTGYYWAGAAIVGNYIIYGDDRANVTCLNKDTGAFVDYINVSGACGVTPVEEIRSSIVWDENTERIYFTGKKASPRSGHAYAVSFNAATGDLGGSCDWVTDIDYSTSTPVVYNGKVYVCMGGMYGGDAAVLKCLDEANGNILYTYDITCPPTGACGSQSSPAVSVWNGHVYIYFTTNMNNGAAYCVEDTGTGFDLRWIWNPPHPDDQFILQGMAISRGIVYFGTDYGRVYALAGICGDVNYDGNVNIADAQKVYNGNYCSEWAADVDCSCNVNIADAQRIYNGNMQCCGP